MGRLIGWGWALSLLAGTLVGCGRDQVAPTVNPKAAKASFQIPLPKPTAVIGVAIGGSPGEEQPVPRSVARDKTRLVASQVLTWLRNAQPVQVSLPSPAVNLINGPSAYYYVVLELSRHRSVTVVPTTYYGHGANGGVTFHYLPPIVTYTNAQGHTLYLKAPRLDKWLRSTRWRSDLSSRTS